MSNPTASEMQAMRKTRRGGPKVKCWCGKCRACKVRAKRSQRSSDTAKSAPHQP